MYLTKTQGQRLLKLCFLFWINEAALEQMQDACVNKAARTKRNAYWVEHEEKELSYSSIDSVQPSYFCELFQDLSIQTHW